jgi:hypothetical protein
LSPIVTALLVFAFVFGAALLGMMLRCFLSEHHLGSDTKDTVKLAMGLVATMAALILGLLVASAKDSYDKESSGVTQMATKVVFLDRLLANYGVDAQPTRELLHHSVDHLVARMWPVKSSEKAQLDPSASRMEAVYAALQKLKPENEMQSGLKSQALATTLELGQMRWLEFEQANIPMSTPLLVVLTFWLAVLFPSFGLFSPSNAIVVVALVLAALSVSGAVFLIQELSSPFSGLMQISNAPFVDAIAHLGQ